MSAFRIEQGLPPYGPPALSFPDPDAFSEGLVVSFTTSSGEGWTGNFAKGYGLLDAVRDELGPAAMIVVARGTAYFLDVGSKAASEITWGVDTIEFVASHNMMVIGNGLWFAAYGPSGRIWQSRRISWDGMRTLEISDQHIRGEAHSPMGPPEWLPFRLEIASGDVDGGSYNGPP